MSNPEQTCFRCDDALSKCECGNTETFENFDGPVCPSCGYLNRASRSEGSLYDQDTYEYECGECGETFDLYIHISYSWTATRRNK